MFLPEHLPGAEVALIGFARMTKVVMVLTVSNWEQNCGIAFGTMRVWLLLEHYSAYTAIQAN